MEYTRYILSADHTEEVEAVFYFDGEELILDNSYLENDYDAEDYVRIFEEVLTLAIADQAAYDEERSVSALEYEAERALRAELNSWLSW